MLYSTKEGNVHTLRDNSSAPAFMSNECSQNSGILLYTQVFQLEKKLPKFEAVAVLQNRKHSYSAFICVLSSAYLAR